jgi:hypothetical protein
MKLLKTLAAAGVIAASTASPAWADWGDLTTPLCGGGLFATCAAVEVTGGGTNTVTITVVNLGGALPGTSDAIFTAVGIYNLPAGVTVQNVAITTANGAEADWAQGAGTDLQPFGHDIAAEAPPPPIGNGLAVGESVTFVITFSGTVSDADLAALGISIHGQSGPNNCSTKLAIEDEGSTVLGAGEPDPSCSETVIPEPITMTLLATGLAGMGGVGFIRRRKKEDELV